MRADVVALAVVVALPAAAQQRGVVSTVSVSKAQVDTGGAVDITVTGTNPCGAVRIDYGDGTDPVTHPLTQLPATVPHVYKQIGRHKVRAEGMGNCDGVAETLIQVNARPAAPAPAPPTAPEPKPNPPAEQIRFREMDTNGDGVITRVEWRGDRRSFREYDSNGDGILSGGELRARADEILVKATERWTDTGLWVRQGELLRIQSAGSIRWSSDPSATAGPGGDVSGRRTPGAPLPSRAIAGLIARVGNSEAVFVGAEDVIRAPASGRLFLGVNDDHVADNSGQFKVRVEVDRTQR